MHLGAGGTATHVYTRAHISYCTVGTEDIVLAKHNIQLLNCFLGHIWIKTEKKLCRLNTACGLSKGVTLNLDHNTFSLMIKCLIPATVKIPKHEALLVIKMFHRTITFWKTLENHRLTHAMWHSNKV